MEITQNNNPTILVLLPYLTKGDLSLAIFREMRKRNLDISIAYFLDKPEQYVPDLAEDFIQENRLHSFFSVPYAERLEALENLIIKNRITLIVQIGGFWAYHLLPYLKERRPKLRIVDILYNEVGHTMDHFLFENCIDGVIVESQKMHQFISKNTYKSAPNIEIIESGVDLTQFTFKNLSTLNKSITFGYLGRMSSEKNPLGFIEIAKYLHPVFPSAIFRMFGQGAMADTVQSQVKTSAIAAVLKFEGYVPHPKNALDQIDILIVPSKLDGRPNAIMEANACGIPVIGAPVGGIPELIVSGENGFLIKPEDSDKMIETLKPIVENKHALAKLQSSSRKIAEERFNRHIMMDMYESVFRKFLAVS